MKTLLAIVGIVVVGVLACAGFYIGAYNSGVQYENQLEAVWEDNKNILGQYSLKVKEAASVSDAYAEDLQTVVAEAMSGRYGDEGSQAVFQWIQEQNPQVDSAVYTKIQQIIEAGRNEFQNAQTRLVDIKRAYKDELGMFWSGFWLNMAGFPKVDLDKYTVITSQHAADAFESGIDNGVDI